MIDVLKGLGIERRPIHERQGVVVTAHRPTNVDIPARLDALVTIVCDLAERLGPVTFPLHPRTGARLEETGLRPRLESAGVRVVAPLPYRAMLELIVGSRLVVTDSGGLQEEASWYGVPVVVLRRSTPRWEGVAIGAATLVGLDRVMALEEAFDVNDESDEGLLVDDDDARLVNGEDDDDDDYEPCGEAERVRPVDRLCGPG